MSVSGSPDTPVRAPPSPREWRTIEPLLDALLDAPPDRRAALLVDLSGGDPARHAELERLLAECERAYPLLEHPVADRFASVFGDEPLAMPESLAGRYRVLSEVGRGGMAIVYLARDLKHGRDVAVKVVRAELAAALGRARFLREIEIAAQLRHPHIVPLYDSGEEPAAPASPERGPPTPALLYYVMPYEQGQSARQRLAQEGPLPVEDTVALLRDVCEALAHAHHHGIVHRDIKPDNVLLSGRHAMITDFGVARALDQASADGTGAVGEMMVGTPRYMAPEQAARDPLVDHRADIYSVGVLAYELLTGETPSDATDSGAEEQARGDDAGATLMARRTDVPAPLARLIARCLSPRPADRWQSADEILAELATIATPTRAMVASSSRRYAVAAIIAAVVTVVLVAVAVPLARGRIDHRPLVLGRAHQLSSEPGLEIQPSMSPDGSHVAYATGNSLQMRIAVRAVNGGKAVPLTSGATDNQWLPRWSPDGRRILFLSRGAAFSAPALGGVPREEIPSRAGAPVESVDWSADSRQIVYVRGDSLLVHTVSGKGARLLTTAADLHSCRWSPDGARIACVSGNSFYVTIGNTFGAGPMFANLAPSSIVVVPAAGGAAVRVTDERWLNQSPVWSRDGRTLYFVSNREGPRDLYALGVGTRAPVRGDPVRVTTGMGVQSVDLSADGTRLVYAVYGSTANVWAMRIPAHPLASVASAIRVTSGNQTVEGIRVSADGRWLVYDSDLSGTSEIYRVPVTGGEPERLTYGPLDKFRGVLSPSGRELVYHAFQAGSRNLFLASLDGRPTLQLTRSPGQRSMANWSPDGTALALFDIGRSEVFVMRRDERGRWSAPRFTGGIGWRPEWAPDGRTIAFVSPVDGRIGSVSADSGAQRDLYVPRPGEPRAELAIYAESGTVLYFKSHDARGRATFWSIPAHGGRPRLLARFDDPARASNRFEFARDSQRLYFTIEDRQSDIWMAEVTP